MNDLKSLINIHNFLNNESKNPLDRIKKGENRDIVQASLVKYPGMNNVRILSIDLRVLYSPKIFKIDFEDEVFKCYMKKEGDFSKNFTKMLYRNSKKAFKLNDCFVWTCWAYARIGIKTYEIILKKQDLTIENTNKVVTIKKLKEKK